MNRGELYNIAKDAVNDTELRSTDIPSIDLYVDQIINLISERIMHGSERYHDRHLTKTMINNYSKDGLITPVKGKKYNKEQILQMLTVYTLKGTLSINEIKRILNGAYEIEGFDGASLTSLYDRHQDIKELNREYAIASIDGIIDRNSLDIENDIDYLSAIFALAAFSAHLKAIAQAMIDAKFPDVEEDEDKDKEKDKDKDKEKKEKEKEKKDKAKDKSEKKAKNEKKKEAELEEAASE